MPDQSSAAREHALIQEITEPLASLPDDAVPVAADADFPLVLRGYDRLAVDAYVKRTSQIVAEMQARSSPQAAVRRALERVGGEVSGILQRAHDTAEEITARSRRDAEDRLQIARDEAARITAEGRERLKELDADTDRIWGERDRIVADARDLARQLTELADVAAARFPPAEETADVPVDETLPLGATAEANGHAPVSFGGDEELDEGIERGGGVYETVEFTTSDLPDMEPGADAPTTRLEPERPAAFDQEAPAHGVVEPEADEHGDAVGEQGGPHREHDGAPGDDLEQGQPGSA